MPEANLAVALVIKPLVLLVTIVAMRRILRDRRVPGARLILFGLALFLVGEVMCGVDVYLIQRMTFGWEAGHDLLMALSAGVLMVGLHDRAAARFRCLNRECARYWSCTLPAIECIDSNRYGALPLYVLPGLALLAAIPMFAVMDPVLAEMPAGLGDRVMGSYLYDRSVAIIVLEQWIMPAVGAVLLLAAALSYAIRRRLARTALWLAGLGLGFVGFAYFRATLVHFFPHAPHTGTVWEEALEAVGVLVLWGWWSASRPQNDRPEVRRLDSRFIGDAAQAVAGAGVDSGLPES